MSINPRCYRKNILSLSRSAPLAAEHRGEAFHLLQICDVVASTAGPSHTAPLPERRGVIEALLARSKPIARSSHALSG